LNVAHKLKIKLKGKIKYMYSLAIQFLYNSMETIGKKIVLANIPTRIDKDKQAPTYEEFYTNPDKYQGRWFL
jgi:hypothetical protein